MKRNFYLLAAALGAITFASSPCRADGKLAPERLDALDERGYFTPAFKAAVHDLVDTQNALKQTSEEKAKLDKDLPDLKKKAAEAQAQAVALRQELAKYDHPEENDFDALSARMKDAAAKPQDQMALAQAYVWTYPASPHAGEAQRILQQLEKTIADQKQAEKDEEAARAAAHAKLVQRALAKDLSLPEWRDFLRDMSQDDLVKLMGRPTSESDGYWIYSGDWVTNEASHRKVGLQINFNGGRVQNVDEKPATP